MKSVFSNHDPAVITAEKLNDVWLDLFKSADEVLIATGYVSNDSIEELHYILEKNPDHIKNIQLLVGMPYLEGFTKIQYESLIKLNNFLNHNERGNVYVSQFMKFHGKLYSFKKNKKIDSMIGSANLSCFWDYKERTYETMLHVDEQNEASKLYSEIKQIINKIGIEISNAPPITKFKSYNIHLEDHQGVEKVAEDELNSLQKNTSKYIFEIPVKTTQKSNLNAFFGEGRRDQRGFTLPRPWYEVELIVSNKITQKKGYPYQKIFFVITDDGWKFSCKTSGDYSKNFRSHNNLKILGKWIKGKLELSGCLKAGQMVTEETLSCYGNNNIKLRSTDDPNLWLLSFEGK